MSEGADPRYEPAISARAGDPVMAAEDGLPPFDPIAVGDLVRILVRDHGLPVDQAAHALAVGMLVAGYPEDYDRVGAADAFDLVHEILNTHQ